MKQNFEKLCHSAYIGLGWSSASSSSARSVTCGEVADFWLSLFEGRDGVCSTLVPAGNTDWLIYRDKNRSMEKVCYKQAHYRKRTNTVCMQVQWVHVCLTFRCTFSYLVFLFNAVLETCHWDKLYFDIAKPITRMIKPADLVSVLWN